MKEEDLQTSEHPERQNVYSDVDCNITLFPLPAFQFQLPLSEVERRTLWVTVWHSDMFGRNDFLGELMLPLQGQIFDDPSPRWYGLQDRVRIHVKNGADLESLSLGIHNAIMVVG